MFRVMLTAIGLFGLASSIFTFFIDDHDILMLSITVLGISLTIFVYTIYNGTNRVEKELQTINRYLKNIEKIDKVNYTANCFTQEFEDINENI